MEMEIEIEMEKVFWSRIQLMDDDDNDDDGGWLMVGL